MITIAIRLRYDYDKTTTYRARLLPFDASKKLTSIFRRSRVVVVSQTYRSRIAIGNCDIGFSLPHGRTEVDFRIGKPRLGRQNLGVGRFFEIDF